MKGIRTPSRKPNEVHHYKSVSSVLLNDISRKRRDPEAPLIVYEKEGMLFNKSLLDWGANVNVKPKALYDKFKFIDIEPIML